MRYALRVFGLLFVLAAVAVLIVDLAGPAEDAGFALMPLGQLWYSLDPASLNLVQAVIERYVWAVLWDPLILTVLQWPAAAVFAGLGGLLLALGFLGGARGAPEEEPEEG